VVEKKANLVRSKKTVRQKRASRINSLRLGFNRSLNQLLPAEKYLLCMRDPFDPRVLGVKAPGGYHDRSIGYQLRQSFQITASSGGGAFQFLLSPHPLQCVIGLSQVGTVVGGITGLTAANFSVTSTYNWNIAGVYNTVGSTTPTSNNFWPSTIGAVRMVGGGFRFRNLQSISQAQGYVTVLDTPFLGHIPTGTVGSTLTDTAWADTSATELINLMCGMQAIPGIGTSSGVPGVKTVPLPALFSKDLLLANAPEDVRVTHFKNAQNQVVAGSTNFLDGDEVVVTKGGVQQDMPSAEWEDFHGWRMFLLSGVGFTPSAPILYGEYITHWEAIEVPSASFGGVYPAADTVVNTSSFESLMSRMERRVHEVSKLVDTGIQMAGFASELIGGLSTSTRSYNRLLT